jgi:2-methylcitrate dehydratase PrpD
MKDITRVLSRYVCESRFDALPPAVQHEGARAFVNWMGCAAGGSREDDVHLAEFNGAVMYLPSYTPVPLNLKLTYLELRP